MIEAPDFGGDQTCARLFSWAGRMTGARSYAVQGAAGLELARLRQFTPARIALGRAGTGVPTTASLRFMLDHAKARDAVHRALDFAQLGEAVAARGWRVAHVRSAAQNRAEYLRRPDLGRRLANEARPALEVLAGDPDVAIVAADGLSATRDRDQPPAAARSFDAGAHGGQARGRSDRARGAGASGGRGRDWRDIGCQARAPARRRATGAFRAADLLSCYVTGIPGLGRLDLARHCVSNIRSAGLPVADAAKQIVRLVNNAFFYRATGIKLNALRATGIPVGASTATFPT